VPSFGFDDDKDINALNSSIGSNSIASYNTVTIKAKWNR